ncbi:MAG TPA: AsmA family protein, partial [Acidocella sp.]
IALFPLLIHHLDILQLTLVKPNIVLESNKAGWADWDFSYPRINVPAVPAGRVAGYKIALQAVEIQNGLLNLKGADAKTSATLSLSRLTGTATSTAAPLHLKAQAVLGETPFTLTGVVGPIERFSNVGDGPWPVDLSLRLGGAKATIKGAIDHPRTAQGYDLALHLDIPALEAVGATLPDLLKNLPPLLDIQASARIVDQNSTLPAIDNLSVKAGASDLSSLLPGLAIKTLDIEMASLDQPLSINATGEKGKVPLALLASFGPPQALFKSALMPASMPPQRNFPVSVLAQLGSARLSVSGAIATPKTLSGAALAINATIPDLSALTPIAGTPLPAWKNIVVQTTLTDPGGLGLRHAIGLDSLIATMDNARFGGDASLFLNQQPRLQLALKFAQVNVDALLAALPAASPPVSATLPAWHLPLQILKASSADIQISADTLIWNRANYTALQAHAVLANGTLSLNHVSGELPGGNVSASATLDATAEPAKETAAVDAPALALSPFLKALGLPDNAEGTVQAQLLATSSGDSAQAIAANLNGQLGLAMVNGVIDGTVLAQLFGTTLRTAGLPASQIGAPGPVAVRCAALRLDAAKGVGTVSAMTLDSSRLLLQSDGSVDFGPGTLNITLRPQAPGGSPEPAAPVKIGGSLAAPTVSVASSAAVVAAGRQGPFSGDVCPAALSLGRLGHPGPAAAPMTQNPSTMNNPPPPATGAPKSLVNLLSGP